MIIKKIMALSLTTPQIKICGISFGFIVIFVFDCNISEIQEQ